MGKTCSNHVKDRGSVYTREKTAQTQADTPTALTKFPPVAGDLDAGAGKQVGDKALGLGGVRPLLWDVQMGKVLLNLRLVDGSRKDGHFLDFGRRGLVSSPAEDAETEGVQGTTFTNEGGGRQGEGKATKRERTTGSTDLVTKREKRTAPELTWVPSWEGSSARLWAGARGESG